MVNELAIFENNYWQQTDQASFVRHRLALELVDQGGETLDLGCGDGLMLSLLGDLGVRAQGMDISSVAIEKCQQKGLTAQVYDFGAGALPFGDREFNNTLLLDVLEHLYFPETVLKEALRVSRSGVIISVPNFSSLPARIQMLLGRVPENNRNKKGHVHWFNWLELQRIVAVSGGQIVEQQFNVFWENKPIVGSLLKKLVRNFPALFALSFIVKITYAA